jgi:hypothetical protein
MHPLDLPGTPTIVLIQSRRSSIPPSANEVAYALYLTPITERTTRRCTFSKMTLGVQGAGPRYVGFALELDEPEYLPRATEVEIICLIGELRSSNKTINVRHHQSGRQLSTASHVLAGLTLPPPPLYIATGLATGNATGRATDRVIGSRTGS